MNTLNSHPVLGTVGLLHSHRPIFPLSSGGTETDDWSLCDWCDQCHRKGGLTLWVDAFEPAGGLVGGDAFVAAIPGQIDAIEITHEPHKVPLLLVLRCGGGFFVPRVGASGKDSNRVALGDVRTLADCREWTWVEAIRVGRTVVTDGPFLRMRNEGDRLRASAAGRSGSARVEIVANGKVVATGEGHIEAVVENGWAAARCYTTKDGFAHTSGVAMSEPTRNPEALTALANLVRQTREWIESNGRFANPKRKASLLACCDEALGKLIRS